MKVFLMYEDKDFDLQRKMPQWKEVVQDLELNVLFDAMAKEDDFFREVSEAAILSPLSDVKSILYRQEILKDCLANPSLIKEMYDISLESFDVEKNTFFGFFSRYPIGMLDSSVKAMTMLVKTLKKLRNIADEKSGKFHSKGFKRFFNMVKNELSDEYFEEVEKHLETLEFKNGMLISADLGMGNKGVNYTLRKPNEEKKRWISKIFSKREEEFTFRIAERDQNGAKALSNLKERGINSVANALTQSVDHILSFFTVLKTELAFYLATMNLYYSLERLEEPLSFPVPHDIGTSIHEFKCLYDPSLALTLNKKVVGNDLKANGKNLFVITGANRGGKSTFLRSIGIAQLMMQSGIFVPAQHFSSSISKKIFTHYKREEDEKMESGKFDEELRRMNKIATDLVPHSMILFNESFSATNEIEGSEIAKEVVLALKEKDVEVFFVTHMYEFAHSMYEKHFDDAIFLVAERLEDGNRTFKIKEGKPLQTSFGIDLYERLFEK